MADTEFMSNPIPYGYCHCGCGRTTQLETRTSQRHSAPAGQPRHYLRGHNARHRITKFYRLLTVDGVLRAVHRLRAESALGKPLPPRAVVHHADGSRSENAPLVICEDASYHLLLHIRMRVKRAGGNPNTDAMCCRCHRALPLAHFRKSTHGRYGHASSCSACERAYQRNWNRHRRPRL